ncbi:hypothetical protein [Streptomyces sp. NPDC088557]|uniref:hypothetical protein n=1 Tax=Streptomyces sp. NPDC088557 TaxID=3365867 RepID=UPI003808C910
MVLDYGHDYCLLRVADPPSNWVALADIARHAHIYVGLDPVADSDDTARYVRRAAAIGRLWSGIAALRV